MDLLRPASAFPRAALAGAVQHLARERGVYLGTSSWKYPGWLGMLYDDERYLHRGRFSEARFERDCLQEYAEVFPSVCVDAAYYRFPSPAYIEGLVRQVPGHFRFSFKVPDDITARTFPKLPRHGAKAGQRNEHFLDTSLFRAGFLASLEPHRSQVGTIIFEFSHFHPRDFTRGREFVEALDSFFQSLPSGWQYAVEVRNRNLLCEPYFEMLAKHQVAHTFNQWTRMPPIQEQMGMPGARTTDFCAARLLLKAGRGYEEAVAGFSPYSETKEVNEEARQAAARLVTEASAPRTGRVRESFIYVNNRLEGNALNTIIAILQKIGALPPEKRST